MFEWAYVGVASGSNVEVISLSGVLTTTSASSPVTSSTRTITGNGTLIFSNVLTDSGTPQYSKNAAAYANITEGMLLAVATGDTLAVRAALPVGGQTASFSLKNNGSMAVIEEPVTLTKS